MIVIVPPGQCCPQSHLTYVSRREGRDHTLVAKVIGSNCCGPGTSNVLPATKLNMVATDLFLHQEKTNAEISDILKQMYHGEKGFSERTVRRFCLINNIVRNHITTDELQGHIRAAVKQVSTVTIACVTSGFKQFERERNLKAGKQVATP